MRRLVVMAHYDARGEVAPHVLRQVDALSEIADRLIVVSTAGLAPDGPAARELSRRAELIRRPNVGYDFYSWRTGLDLATDLHRFDQVVICNDSCIGPLAGYQPIFTAMQDRRCDFWGITMTRRRAPHVQSYFVAFGRHVVASPAFGDFWQRMTPISDRAEVITRYELGLSGGLIGAGFTPGAYFVPTRHDRRVARARHLWWATQTLRRLPAHRQRRAARRIPLEPWNPVTALADRALDHARLPLVKIDTLRFDPYGLDARRLLAGCERRYPEQFAGVREFLERTAAAYPVRAGERSGPARPPFGLRHVLGYGR
jgi:lipopolysaccharide biosynthesis protein